MKDLTVVIAAYNCKDTILSAINSIEKDIQIIVVNDGSTDGTDKILEDLALKKEIKLISIKNHGVSFARNTGLKYVSTSYVMFLDSDDCYCNMNKLINSYCLESNFIIGSYNAITTNKIVKRCISKKTIIKDKDKLSSIFLIKLYKEHMFKSVWNKIYDMKIIKENNIKFNINKNNGEDEEFNIKYFLFSKKIIVNPNITYIYNVNSNGLHRKNELKNICDKIENCNLQRSLSSKLIFKSYCKLQLLKRLIQLKLYVKKNKSLDGCYLLERIITKIDKNDYINYFIIKNILKEEKK